MGVTTAASLLILAGALARGQEFEVASIKPAPPPDGRGMRVWSRGGPGTDDPGLFTCENYGVSWLIMRAYKLESYEFSGPDWMEATRFNISAKIPEGTTKEQFQQMLQNLLKDRFKLTFHREKKEMQGFELVVAKNGPKFKEHVEAAPTEGDAPHPDFKKKDEDGFPVLPPGRKPMMMGIVGGFSTERFVEETMAQLTSMLSFRLHGPVMDATGLNGKYDFTLRWIQDGGVPSADSPGPAIQQAIQEQLGLKVQPKKATVDMFVVDHIEKTPTEN
jgi:uncharacterized protein (TIGR03435 family)